MRLLHRLPHILINLQHKRYHQIQHNKHSKHPKRDEVDAGPVIADYVWEHVACDEPVVDDHYVEEGDEGGAEVVEVH